MHVLTFAYPTEPGVAFDLEHYMKVHLPLGAGLTDKFLGMKIPQMILQRVRTEGAGAEQAPYYMLCHVLFDSKDDLERFATLFSYPEAAERLSKDWPKYTPHDPEVLLSEWETIGSERIGRMIECFRTTMG